MASSSTVHAPERSKIEQIVVEFFAKSLHIILEARIPFLGGDSDYLGSSASSSTSGPKTRDRWFNLALGDCTSALENFEPWRRSFSDPMVVDILLDHSKFSDRKSCGPRVAPADQLHSAKGGPNTLEGISTTTANNATVLERWTVQFERRKRSSMLGFSSASIGASASAVGTGHDARMEGRMQAGEGQEARINPKEVVSGSGSGSRSQKSRIDDTAARGGGQPLPMHVTEVSAVYKRTVVMLRSLYSRCRLLPAYRMFKISSSPTNCCDFSLSYRVLSSASLLSESESKDMSVYDFTPVETAFGRMCLSVEYRLNTAVIAMEVVSSIPYRIIPDYVGSPTTDPLKRFTGEPHSLPASGMPIGHTMNMVSIPSSWQNSSPLLLMGRRHSWSGRVHQVQPALQPPSSPSYRISRSPSPSYPFHPSPPYPPSPCSPYSQKHPSSDLSCSPLSSPFSSADRLSRVSTKVSQPISIDNRCSPPFSPSPSPSPPTMYRGSDPVSIPRPSQSRGSKLSVGDTHRRNRNLLPPLSSSAKKAGGLPRSFSESPRYSEQLLSQAHQSRSFESPLQLQDDHGQQTTISRSRMKTALGDDDEDDDFLYPFAVNDVDVGEKRSSRTESFGRSGEPPESSTGSGSQQQQRSPNAAADVLICTLKSAAPLRRAMSVVGGEALDSSLLFGASERELMGAERSRVHPSSSELTGKTVRGSLEDLGFYRNMRDRMQLRRDEDAPHASSRSRAPPG